MKSTIFFFMFMVLLSCNTEKKQSNIVNQKNDNINKSSKDNSIDYSIGPPTIIYKTKKDYYDKIPVSMNDEKTKIVSYPDVKDIYYKGELAYPTKLDDGYLLDNRGIGKNTVFLSITYEEYNKLAEVPTIDAMMKLIIDKEPFAEIYDCGNRYQYKDIVTDLNKIISDKQLNKFKKIY